MAASWNLEERGGGGWGAAVDGVEGGGRRKKVRRNICMFFSLKDERLFFQLVLSDI